MLALVALVTGAASVALAPASASASTGAVPQARAGASYLNDVRLNLTAQDAAERLMRLPLSDRSFGGVAVVGSGLQVSVHGAASGALGSALASARRSVPVTVKQVANSLADLKVVASAVSGDVPDWKGQGIDVSTWGAQPSTGKLLIGLSSWSKKKASTVVAAYGADKVSVMPKSVQARAATRTNDTSPFRAGNEMTDGVYECTSWFNTKSATAPTLTEYQLIAAHCTGGTWRVINGGSWGTPRTVKWGGKVDAETFRADGETTVWADPAFTYRTVTAVSSSHPEGGMVCTDGFVDREVCGVRITIPSATVTYNGHTVSDTVYAEQTSGRNAFSPGDSGGPVYTTSATNQQITARGMILATATNDYSVGWYGKATNIQSAFNLKIVVS